MGIGIKEVDRGWNGMLDALRVYKSKNVHVKVGFLDDGGKGSDDHGGLTTAELAGVHEFGTEDGHIPARSFVGSMFEKNREKYQEDLKKCLASVLAGKITMEQAFNIMGARMANDIKRAVTSGDGIPPPLAESTIAAKGSDRPLVDTARMLGAITWHVVMNGTKGEGLLGNDVPVKPPVKERKEQPKRASRKANRERASDDTPVTVIQGKPHGKGSPVHYTPKGDDKPSKSEAPKKGRTRKPSKTTAPRKGSERLLTKQEAQDELTTVHIKEGFG